MMRFFLILTAFLPLALFTSGAAFADEEINQYLVENISENVVAKSPSQARVMAVQNAHRDAFAVLLTRLSLPANTTARITDEEITDMVRSEQISDEKITPNGYSASFSITFAKDFVDYILAQKNLTESTMLPFGWSSPNGYSEQFLLIPAKILPRKILLWEESNDWKAALRRQIKDADGFKIPDADIDDVAILNAGNVSRIDVASLEPMFSKYKTSMIYIVLFSYNTVDNKASVVLRGLGKFRKTQAKLTFVNAEGLDGQELLDKVAVKTADYLLGLKADASKSQGEQVPIEMTVMINNLGDWLMVKSKLENSSLISKMSIETVSRDYIKISVIISSEGMDIIDSFATIGLTLNKKDDNSYIINYPSS